MDCRCRKLSLFFCKFLSAVGVLEQDCRYIFCNFGAMSLVAKTPWKASLVKNFTVYESWNFLTQVSLTFHITNKVKLSEDNVGQFSGRINIQNFSCMT